MFGAGLFQPVVQRLVTQEFDAANDSAVQVDQRFHRGHQEGARTAGRVEQTQLGQDQQ